MSIGDGLSWAFKRLGSTSATAGRHARVRRHLRRVEQRRLSFIARLASSDVVVKHLLGSGFVFLLGQHDDGSARDRHHVARKLVVLAIAGDRVGIYRWTAGYRRWAAGVDRIFFKPRNVGGMIIATLIVGVLTTIGMVLCVVPGLLVSIFTMFDGGIARQESAADRRDKASFEIVKAKFIDCLLVWLMASR